MDSYWDILPFDLQELILNKKNDLEYIEKIKPNEWNTLKDYKTDITPLIEYINKYINKYNHYDDDIEIRFMITKDFVYNGCHFKTPFIDISSTTFNIKYKYKFSAFNLIFGGSNEYILDKEVQKIINDVRDEIKETLKEYKIKRNNILKRI